MATMTSLTPVVLLAGFCAVMSAVAAWQLVADDGLDPIDVGTTLLVVAITLGTVVWATISESWLTWTGRLSIAVVGVVLGCIGLALVVSHWNDPSRSSGETDLETGDDHL